jgi:hypothetical protein
MHPHVFYAFQEALSFCLAFIRQHGVRSNQIFTVRDTIFQHAHGWKASLEEEWYGISELQWLSVATEPVNQARHATLHKAFKLLYTPQ